jgi:hypothetical protein
MKILNNKRDIKNVKNEAIQSVVQNIIDRGEFEDISYVCILSKTDYINHLSLTGNHYLDLTNPPYKTKYFLNSEKTILRMSMRCNPRCFAHFILTGENIGYILD